MAFRRNWCPKIMHTSGSRKRCAPGWGFASSRFLWRVQPRERIRLLAFTTFRSALLRKADLTPTRVSVRVGSTGVIGVLQAHREVSELVRKQPLQLEDAVLKSQTAPAAFSHADTTQHFALCGDARRIPALVGRHPLCTERTLLRLRKRLQLHRIMKQRSAVASSSGPLRRSV